MCALAASPTIKPAELKRLIDAAGAVLLLDVREPDEFADWHIPGARNLPLGQLLSATDVGARPGETVVTICSHGMRSDRARQALGARGIAARTLEGGMVAWNTVYDVVPVTRGTDTAKLEVLQLRRVAKGCLSYLVVSGGEAVVIDPTIDLDAYVDAAKARGARIRAVLETHTHADHASGAAELARRTGAPYLSPEELAPALGAERVVDGQDIRVGSATLRAIATPGHTPASVSYLLGTLLFTGDTLFVDGVGRPDLGQDPRPNAAVLWDSLHRKVLKLPPLTRALPAHVGPTVTTRREEPVTGTLAELRARLPALSLDKGAFVEWIVKNAQTKPGNFEALKAHNRGTAPIEDPDELRELEAGPNRCAVAG